MPRDVADVISMAPPATPAPSGSALPSETPMASVRRSAGVTSIAAARAAAKNARFTVRGVVTLPPGIVDGQTAVIQDVSGAILLRLGGRWAASSLGERVEVDGNRSTKTGMETLRVTESAIHLGSAPARDARPPTGDAGEAHEATLVTVAGALATAPRRSSSGSVTFDIDDGQRPLKIAFGAVARARPARRSRRVPGSRSLACWAR